MFKIKPTGGSFSTISTDTTNPYQGSLNTITKDDGTYVLRAQIFDNVNRSVNKDLNITIDNTVPIISTANLTNATTSNNVYVKNSDSIELTATITDTNQTNITTSMITADLSELGGGVSVNPVSYDTVTGLATWSSLTASGTTDSLVTVTVNASDLAGNSASFDTDTIQADNTNPESTITAPSNSGTGSTIYTNEWDGSIAGTSSDATSGVDSVALSISRISDGLYWDGANWVAGSESTTRVTATGTDPWTYDLSYPVEDSYTITSHAIDGAGNVENSYVLTIIFDKTIPEVAISLSPATPDASNGWYKTQPEVTLTATDDIYLDKIEYQWDSQTGSWNSYSVPFKPPTEGAHVLYYRAHDLADNYSGVGIKNIKWDKTELTNVPLNVQVSPNPTADTTSIVTWEAASDNIGIDHYEVQWRLGDLVYTDSVGSDIQTHEINNLLEGDWNVTVRAFDAAGNSKEASVSLTVDRTAPASPTLTLTGTAIGTANLSWNAVSGANSYIVWYGTTPGNYIYGANVGNVTSYTVSGLGAGNYYFIVRAHDASGNGSGNSNEVSTGTIAGTPGVEPGTPAAGFVEEPAVLGEQTESVNATTSENDGSVLGTNISKWWYWLLLLPFGWTIYLVWKKLYLVN